MVTQMKILADDVIDLTMMMMTSSSLESMCLCVPVLPCAREKSRAKAKLAADVGGVRARRWLSEMALHALGPAVRQLWPLQQPI
jgi:hypothetical protein